MKCCKGNCPRNDKKYTKRKMDYWNCLNGIGLKRNSKYNIGERDLMKLCEGNCPRKDKKYTKGKIDYWNCLDGIGLKGIQKE